MAMTLQALTMDPLQALQQATTMDPHPHQAITLMHILPVLMHILPVVPLLVQLLTLHLAAVEVKTPRAVEAELA